MVDMLDLESSAFRCAGSSPALGSLLIFCKKYLAIYPEFGIRSNIGQKICHSERLTTVIIRGSSAGRASDC